MAKKYYKTKKSKLKAKPEGGFTLVELAIVIVIIGFIIAGITAGASLVKQAQLRSVITDYNNYQVAYNSFLGRYVAIPGDFNRAFAYWPDTSGTNSCGDASATCIGDGNGLIDYSVNEGRKAWRHLVLAGMISANVPAMTSANVGTILVGVQTPISKVNGAGYIMAGYDSGNLAFAGTNNMTSPWAGTGKNSVWLGKANNAAGDTNKGLSKGALSPDDAFSVDQKADDGQVIDATNSTAATFNGATTGVVRAMNDPTITTNPCIVTATNSYNAGNSAAVQQTSCVLGFQLN